MNKKTLLVLTTANQIEYTKKAIKSIESCHLNNMDFIVIDDASADGTVEYCHDNGIKVIAKKKPKGVTHSWNMGYSYFKKGNYDYLIFANNDILIPKGAIENFIRVLDEKIIVGALSTEKGVPFDPAQALKKHFKVEEFGFDPEIPENYQKTQLFLEGLSKDKLFSPVKKVNGFFFGVNKSIIKYELDTDILFDPSLINVGNEYELCERVAGEKAICLNAFIFHYKGASFIEHDIDPRYDYGRQLTWREARTLKKNYALRSVYRVRNKFKSWLPQEARQRKARKKDFLKNFFGHITQVALYKYSARIISFLASIIISRLLTPSEYGFVALITVFSAFIVTFLDAGISAAAIRHKYDEKYYGSLQFLVILIGIFLGIVMMALSVPVSRFYGNDELILPVLVFGIIIFSKSLPVMPEAILSKQLKFRTVARISLVETVSTIIFTIILALMGYSYWSIIIPQLTAPLLTNFLYRKVVKMPVAIPSRVHIKEAFNKTKQLSKNIVTFTFFNYWARNSDNLLIGKLYGEGSLGIYNRSYALLELPLGMLTGILNSVQLPSFQKLIEQGKEISTEYEIILRMTNILMFPVSAVLILFPYQISTILWGENWSAVGDFLPVFGTLLILQSMLSTSGPMFIVFKKEKTFAWVGSINALIMIAAIVIGSFYSLMSIAYFYAFSYILICAPVLFIWGYLKCFRFNFLQLASTFFIDWLFSVIILINISIFQIDKILYLSLLVFFILKVIQTVILLRKINIR